jgi:UDP-N-acetylglucosamine diphosphorylase/glucosamine-1-phosphate N-acetyltransferase
MNIVFFDDQTWKNLNPITLTRPVADVRIGILKISEKWNYFLTEKVFYKTENYLSKKFPNTIHEKTYCIYINGSVIPTSKLVEEVKKLLPGEKIVYNGILIAYFPEENQADENNLVIYSEKKLKEDLIVIRNIWDIFSLNAAALKLDFELITSGRYSQELPASNKYIKPENIFIEEGAKVECCILNASEGPIYLGKNSEIMEGSVIRGPFALCEGAVVKLATKVYGATTVGPESRIGGEVNNSVIQGYSNKVHDGFLGNSVVGEWCNLGADTNNSNLKNNYGNVDIWNYNQSKYIDTGLQFCGLFMGDHSKCGINTMFNTGTVVGVSANIFGAGFPDKYIPSFSWGGPQNPFQKFRLEKAIELAEIVMSRRKINLSEEDKEILNYLSEQ